MKLNFLDYNSKFSQFFIRIMDLILLNVVFIVTCIPIFTIGASITALYSTTLKMIRNEEGYIIRGYFKDFAKNFKQATGFWLIALLLYFLLYVIYLAAQVNGGMLFRVYMVITAVWAILFFVFFMYVFPLIATFENSFKGVIKTAISMIIAHFPVTLTTFLCTAIPLFVSFGVNTKIMAYASLFWILIGFSLIAFWSSYYLNKAFVRYIPEEESDDSFHMKM